jgi:hypothetical protein
VEEGEGGGTREEGGGRFSQNENFTSHGGLSWKMRGL